MSGRRIHVDGTVQGVGFRPFVWSLAQRLHVSGWVRNSTSGVDIHIEGASDSLEAFVTALRRDGPPLSRIDTIRVMDSVPETGNARDGFAIVASRARPGESLPVAADIAPCDDCLRELSDPGDRRYRYPFLNCTNCGPRFTIVRDLPYDRARTTMAAFPLCAACAAEYADPANRRFHAQPVACPACGPQLWLEEAGDATRVAQREEALQRARDCLVAGGIVAVKGLGGFHLACDATQEHAVETLRRRKQRDAKPLALMAASLEVIERHAAVSPAARRLLQSPERPVLLLPRRLPSSLADAVAPGRAQLGFMLPGTPLHHLLLQDMPPLVMTSANRSHAPILIDNDEARSRLARIADVLLVHDRDIAMRNDDSVGVAFRDHLVLHRRSRGLAPRPVSLPFTPSCSILAVGGELKNTFCLTRGARAFLSHHIGDLDDDETLRCFEAAVDHFERLFRIEPAAVVHDLHPDAPTTRYALRRAAAAGIPCLAVQHHHAHIAACMADNAVPRSQRVLGVAFDGSGYGTDGSIWGGEFLVAGYDDAARPVHLRPWPLPGGDAAVRKPYRTALSLLQSCGVPWRRSPTSLAAAPASEIPILRQQLRARLNTPLTSSMGRLFDAVSSLTGIRHIVHTEAQAACELEAAAARADRARPYRFGWRGDCVDPAPLVRALVADVSDGIRVERIALGFHLAVADMVVRVCERLRNVTGLGRVALSGGVWLNQLLLERSVDALEEHGFTVLVHRDVPAGDGGLALGQAVVAAHQLESSS